MPNERRRICVMRAGYAVVPGNSDEEALENAKNLKEDDFDWEPVNSDMIEAEAEVVETLGPNEV